ncbi:hypothetical protein [Paraflavitalea sp. CAU 1676]|uniref:hypothetical protein n=1 Tax=Paraflavitalea sp. CAU 1676 TaxID=3032598 RepID=UPI0023DB10EF|nr:hypothetical protein [Paraflavitalea sp. CAU 1676]MDF2188253.1 hypothetical protein [Paraflavitalea sp. CAU 1676]
MPRRKSNPLTRKRLLKDPAFERSRENMADFARAGSANKLLRRALRPIIPLCADRYLSGRLTKRMAAIVYSDPAGSRGAQKITREALPILTGFNLNKAKYLQDAFYACYEVTADLDNGKIELYVPYLMASTMFNAPSSTHQVEVMACAASVDFDRQEIHYLETARQQFAVNDTAIRSVRLAIDVGKETTDPIIVLLGINYLTAVCDNKMAIIDKALNAMAVVKVFT